ncbi:MAG: hypothetical protein M1335_01750, partial [Chloroflexi bacterium]|nr:hypothetical protein [Chloroflexota bacterium]
MRFSRPGRFNPGLSVALVLAVVLSACSHLGVTTETTPTPSHVVVSAPAPRQQVIPTAAPTILPPTPTSQPPTATPSTDALKNAVDQYVKDWEAGRYTDMYQLLSTQAQKTTSQATFVSRYTDISSGIDQISVVVTTTIPSNVRPTGTPPSVQIPMQVTHKLAVLGDITEDNQLPLVQEGGTWKIAWTPGLIFKDLTATRFVRYDAVNPKRGSILDRNGNVLAEDGNILTIGIVPGEIKDEAAMLKALSDYLHMPADAIKKLYAGAQPNWFVPVKDLPESDKPAAQKQLGSVLGVALRDRQRRVYPYGAAAADFVGYVSPVDQSDLKTLRPQGYDIGDYVGRAGIESWGEKYLAGQKGATLAIVDQSGQVVRTIAQKPAIPGDTIITSVDINYQIEANKILGNHAGSLIVMNPQDNSILALSSNPLFDPNLFVLGMTNAQWQSLNSATKPLLFRPAQGV